MYIVTKDGMYLMSYQDFGIREIDKTGEYKTMLTGLYSTRRKDAMLVESKAIADALGAKAEKVSIKETAKGAYRQ